MKPVKGWAVLTRDEWTPDNRKPVYELAAFGNGHDEDFYPVFYTGRGARDWIRRESIRGPHSIVRVLISEVKKK